jgi:DNA invertase Pin-like site-specific DNA recombinase
MGSKCELLRSSIFFDTRTPAGKTMFQMMGVFAEFERPSFRNESVTGLSAPRARANS